MVLTGIDASEYCRFGIAKKLGADYIVNIQNENLLDKVKELTDGKGADVVIETSGAPSAIVQCVDLLKRNGRLIGMGMPGGNKVEVPWKDAVLKSLEFYFSMSTSYTAWDKALHLLSTDSEKLQNIVTWAGDIKDWEEIFDSLVNEKNVKAVFTF